MVALTRSLVGCTPVVAGPAHDDMISRVEVDQDPLSGRIMKSVDPDEESGEQVSLMAVPAVDRDACHTEWWETVVDDMVMEKFILVPEVCPVVSMSSAAEPTLWLALSEVYSPVVLAGGGGEGGCCGIPPGSGGVRYSASVCPAGCRKRAFGCFCGEGHLGCGQFERWPVVSPSGFRGNPAGFAGRAKCEEFHSFRHIPGRWAYGGGASSGTNRAFGSGKAAGRLTYGWGCLFWNH